MARRASVHSGVGADILKRMLPVLATPAAGTLARRRAGGLRPQAGMTPSPAGAPPGGSLIDILTPMLDANRDGSAVDDINAMIGKAMGGR